MHNSPAKIALLLAAPILAALALPGCVERRITIGSDPEGALLTLNDQEVGRTPVTVPFTWYGDYDIVLRKEINVGTEDDPIIKRYYIHTHKRTHPPIYQFIGLDLLAELTPVTLKDEKIWAFTVPEVVEPADDDLMARAKQLKGELDRPEALQKNKRKVNEKPAPTTRPKPVASQ